MSFYYVRRADNRFAFSSTDRVSDSLLIEVDSPSFNQYQIWDGEKWLGRTESLETRYGEFRVKMLSSSGWVKMRNAAISFAPEFLSAVAYMKDNPSMVKYLWNQIVVRVETLSAQDLEQWNQIVSTIEIGIEWIGDRVLAFDFDSEGKML